jgi:hypothetical protein
LGRPADECDRRGQEVTGSDRKGHFSCEKVLDRFQENSKHQDPNSRKGLNSKTDKEPRKDGSQEKK